jgi:hypothetical protein
VHQHICTSAGQLRRHALFCSGYGSGKEELPRPVGLGQLSPSGCGVHARACCVLLTLTAVQHAIDRCPCATELCRREGDADAGRLGASMRARFPQRRRWRHAAFGFPRQPMPAKGLGDVSACPRPHSPPVRIVPQPPTRFGGTGPITYSAQGCGSLFGPMAVQ